jgi:hypothetical protein
LSGQIAPMDSSAQVPAPTEGPSPTPEVRRAEAVSSAQQLDAAEVPIKLAPPKPIDF